MQAEGATMRRRSMAVAAPVLAQTDRAMSRLQGLLDLSNVRMKLVDVEVGKGYDPAQLDLMEQEYRRFLALHLAYPEMDVVPCKIVDELWHQHILDTAAYREDCEAIFGFFLDHFRYFGMRGADDERALNDAYAETLDRYREAFGEPPPDTWVTIDASSRCKRTACKPQKCK
jgi:hypothetical protein